MNRRDMVMGGGALGLMAMTQHASATTRPGFHVPAEEGPHQQTFMQWPVNRRVYSDRIFLEMVQRTIARVANAIAEFEPVVMLAAADDHAAARALLSKNVTLWDIPTEDLWCRDAGPIFVVGPAGELAVTHIQFNGWGDKQVHTRDGQIAAMVAKRLGLELRPTGLRGEGGGVEQDGHGLLMAHESSWVNENRNPSLSRDEITNRLLRAYGAERMLWSPGLWDQDITYYHIDSLARFTGAGRVLMNLPEEPDTRDPFHLTALETHDMLVASPTW